MLPDNNEAAVEEAEHLIERSDSDKDGKLSIEEIVNNHEDFVGSQATNYGEFLPKDELWWLILTYLVIFVLKSTIYFLTILLPRLVNYTSILYNGRSFILLLSWAYD